MEIFSINLFGFTLSPSYYGLMYVLGFVYGLWAIKKTGRYTSSERENLFLYMFFGVIVGGRLGNFLFYDMASVFHDPFVIFRVWEGGMAFHGGLVGVILALILYSYRYKKRFLQLTDDIALIAPVGLFFGRIGNYLNKELLGFPYEGFLAVQTGAGSFFPSPLVEAFLEGCVLFIVLICFAKLPRITKGSVVRGMKLVGRYRGQISALFLIFYGLFRTLVEIFIRQPDVHIGYYFGFLSQGSILSLPMMVLGIALYMYLINKK